MKLAIACLTVLSFLHAPITAAELVAARETAPAQEEENNKALARRFYEEVWFSRNLDVVDELFAPQYILHDTGDNKGVTETADAQKQIADFFWRNGTMTGRIDYQIAAGELVATRWQWDFQPNAWWMRLLSFGTRNPIPIVNVFRFQDGKIVEIWNHRHDIDTLQRNLPFVQGLGVGVLGTSIVALVLGARRRRRTRPVSEAG